MREILPGMLWLGNAADARDVESILQAGIVAVMELAIEQPVQPFPRSMVYCRFPILDGQQGSQEVLRAAIETLISLLKEKIRTLVYCGAGMSRSPAVIAGALSILHGGSPDERLRQIVSGYPHDVSPQLWRDIREICAQMKQT